MTRKTCHTTFTEIKVGTRGKLFAGAGYDVEAKVLKAFKISVYIPLSGVAFEGAEWWNGDILGMPMQDYDVWDIDKMRKHCTTVVRLLNMGHNVGIACSGGHGRTGAFLAAIGIHCNITKQKENPIDWIRKVYCEKAVEASIQGALLFRMSGLEPLSPAEFGQKYGKSYEYSPYVNGPHANAADRYDPWDAWEAWGPKPQQATYEAKPKLKKKRKQKQTAGNVIQGKDAKIWNQIDVDSEFMWEQDILVVED